MKLAGLEESGGKEGVNDWGMKESGTAKVNN